MMTAAVISANSVPATPTPTNSDTLTPLTCGGEVVETAIVVLNSMADIGRVATGSGGRAVSVELERYKYMQKKLWTSTYKCIILKRVMIYLLSFIVLAGLKELVIFSIEAKLVGLFTSVELVVI